MPDTVLIKWGSGYMNLFMPEFFPCSKSKFNKVLKLIREDWENQDAIRETLKVHFQNRIEDLKPLMKKKANEYADAKTFIAEGGQQIKARKFPNGLPMNPDQVAELRNAVTDRRAEAADILADFHRMERQSKQFPELLKMLEGEING